MERVQIRFFDLNRFNKRSFEGFVACFPVRQIKVCEHIGKQDQNQPVTATCKKRYRYLVKRGSCFLKELFLLEKGRWLCLTKRFDVSRQNACASYQDQWCAPAQPKESPRGNSTREVRRYHGFKWLGKIVARL